MNWIKLTDELPKHKQNIDLWLQPESGEGRRFNWTWEGQDSAGIMINGIKATHWIDVGKPSESKPADLKNANCAIFDVNGSLLIDFAVYLTGHDKETIEQMYNDWRKCR